MDRIEVDRTDQRPRVGRVARALGGAGLLPQLAMLFLGTRNPGTDAGAIGAFGYGSLILSFLGGIWWGMAMHRADRQRVLVAIAVLPSLVPVALVPVIVFLGWRWALVALGCALMLTLPVDRRLVERGDAPDGWMGLRVPLSAGLGLLTILAGVLA